MAQIAIVAGHCCVGPHESVLNYLKQPFIKPAVDKGASVVSIREYRVQVAVVTAFLADVVRGCVRAVWCLAVPGRCVVPGRSVVPCDYSMRWGYRGT